MEVSRREFELAEEKEIEEKKSLKERILNFLIKNRGSAYPFVDIVLAINPNFYKDLEHLDHPIFTFGKSMPFSIALMQLEREGKIKKTRINSTEYFIVY